MLAYRPQPPRRAVGLVDSSREEAGGSLLRLDFGSAPNGYSCNMRWLAKASMRRQCVDTLAAFGTVAAGFITLLQWAEAV